MRRLLPTLLFALAATLPARAWVTLTLSVDRGGSAEVRLLFGAKPKDLDPWWQALKQTLPVPMENGATRWETARGPWSMVATVPHLERRWARYQGSLDRRPIEAVARKQGETLGLVLIEFPFEPASRVPGASDFTEDGDITRWYDATGIHSRPVTFAWGYQPGVVARAVAWPLLALLAPVLIAALGARAAVRARIDDPARVWFGHWRLLRLLMYGTWIAWGMAVIATHATEVVEFAAGGAVGAQVAAFGIFVFVPPVLATLACQVVSWPVSVKVRGAEWTAADVFRQVMWALLAGAVAASFFFVGMGAAMDGHPAPAAAGLLGGFLAFVFGRLGHSRAAGMAWHALSTGELRDAVFALAEKAKVPLRGVYVLPAGRGRLVNAFAASGGSLLFSDALVSQMSRREVLAVAAHELTHLRKGHANGVRARLPFLLFVVLGGAVGGFVAAFPSLERLGPLAPLGILIVVVIVAWMSRRRERAADAGSAELTGEPEAMITALARLSRLNSIPVAWSRWDERLLTHPSTRHRAEALARAAGIPDARLAELLDPPDPPEEGFPLPPAHAERLFSTRWKTDTMLLLGWSQVAVTAIPLAVAARLAAARPGGEPAILAIGLFAAAFLWWLAYTRQAPRALLRLAGPLARRLETEGIPTSRGTFISLAPHGDPRVYEGFTEWDAGYLFVDAEALYYFGEQARFRLPFEGLHVEPASDMPALMRDVAARVEWAGGAFRLHAPSGSRADTRRATEGLVSRLRAPSGEAPPLPEVGPPAFGEVTSRPPCADVRFAGMIGNAMVYGLVGYAVALIAGAPPVGPAWVSAALCAAFGTLPFLPCLRRARRKKGKHHGGTEGTEDAESAIEHSTTDTDR